MDIHQCMTCGERWGVGTSAFGMRAAKHQAKGHLVLIGDADVLRVRAEASGLDLSVSEDPLELFRCLTCDEHWVHGSEEAADRALEHTSQGHKVYQGAERDMLALTFDKIANKDPQTPNPMNPDSLAGGGTIAAYGVGDTVRY